MKKITVEITFDDPSNPDAFKNMDAKGIWDALCFAFHLFPESAITVQELDADNRSTITVGDPAGGR